MDLRADFRQPNEGPWRINRRHLRRAAKTYGPPWTLTGVVLRQFFAERRLRRLGRDFRSHDNAQACAAYEHMSPDEFMRINARQAWANWRTIPNSLDGHLPSRPLRALDLACGAGDSTAALAWCLPPGSLVLGVDIAPELIQRASQRIFADHNHDSITVHFRQQSILDTLHDQNGEPLPDHSIDVICSCGAIGSHFAGDTTRQLARECARIIRPNGVATIDSGPDGTTPQEAIAIFEGVGFRPLQTTRSCIWDRFQQLSFRWHGDGSATALPSAAHATP